MIIGWYAKTYTRSCLIFRTGEFRHHIVSLLFSLFDTPRRSGSPHFVVSHKQLCCIKPKVIWSPSVGKHEINSLQTLTSLVLIPTLKIEHF